MVFLSIHLFRNFYFQFCLFLSFLLKSFNLQLKNQDKALYWLLPTYYMKLDHQSPQRDGHWVISAPRIIFLGQHIRDTSCTDTWHHLKSHRPITFKIATPFSREIIAPTFFQTAYPARLILAFWVCPSYAYVTRFLFHVTNNNKKRAAPQHKLAPPQAHHHQTTRCCCSYLCLDFVWTWQPKSISTEPFKWRY